VTVPDLVPYGWTDRWAALFAAATDDPPRPGAQPGRVLRHDGAGLLVALPGGPRALALAGLVDPPPTVGDWLVVDGDVPAAVLDRTSLLARRAAASDTPQLLAANVDLVLAVCGLDRPVKAGRIDRVATLAWDAGAVPAVVLTKADLVADPAERADAVATAHPGLDVVATSAATGAGLGALRALVGDRTVVLVGESGAGKSSLTNALAGDDVAATGRVRAGDAKGRHTTSSRHALPLPGVASSSTRPGCGPSACGPSGRRWPPPSPTSTTSPRAAASGTAATAASRGARSPPRSPTGVWRPIGSTAGGHSGGRRRRPSGGPRPTSSGRTGSGSPGWPGRRSGARAATDPIAAPGAVSATARAAGTTRARGRGRRPG
jgi:hypothetical protein